METKTEYVTVWAHAAAELDPKVNERLKDGWALYGSPYAVGSGHGAFIHQAVTKEFRVPQRVGAL